MFLKIKSHVFITSSIIDTNFQHLESIKKLYNLNNFPVFLPLALFSFYFLLNLFFQKL